MPVDYSRTEDGGVLVKGSGVVTGSEIVAVSNALYDKPGDIAGIRYQVCDLTDVEDIVLNSAEIRELAEQDSNAGQSNPNMIIAVVATSDVVYGLARMWDSTVDDKVISTRVFRKMDEARKWVDLQLIHRANQDVDTQTRKG